MRVFWSEMQLITTILMTILMVVAAFVLGMSMLYAVTGGREQQDGLLEKALFVLVMIVLVVLVYVSVLEIWRWVG